MKKRECRLSGAESAPGRSSLKLCANTLDSRNPSAERTAPPKMQPRNPALDRTLTLRTVGDGTVTFALSEVMEIILRVGRTVVRLQSGQKYWLTATAANELGAAMLEIRQEERHG